MVVKEMAMRKWMPVLTQIGIKNEWLLAPVSIYCELYSQEPWFGGQQSLLPKKLGEVKEKLFGIYRKRIKSEVFNLVTGEKEIELEGGLIVNYGCDNKLELSESDFRDLFGELALKVMKVMDIKGFRDKRINNILNGSES